MTSVEVTVDLERADAPKIELRVSMERTNDFVAHTEGTDMWGVLDGAIHKIEEQIRRHKAKKGDHRTTPRRDDPAWVEAAVEDDGDEDSDLDDGDEQSS
jgi:putative sigma-54 modulation protein